MLYSTGSFKPSLLTPKNTVCRYNFVPPTGQKINVKINGVLNDGEMVTFISSVGGTESAKTFGQRRNLGKFAQNDLPLFASSHLICL